MLEYFKQLFSSDDSPTAESSHDVDISAVIAEVKANELEDIPTGRRIHTLEHGSLEIRLDRDITGHYRVTVYEGADRRYSFTVFAKEGEYPILEKAYGEIIDFLEGDRHLSEIPDKEFIKGFYYGD